VSCFRQQGLSSRDQAGVPASPGDEWLASPFAQALRRRDVANGGRTGQLVTESGSAKTRCSPRTCDPVSGHFDPQ